MLVCNCVRVQCGVCCECQSLVLTLHENPTNTRHPCTNTRSVKSLDIHRTLRVTMDIKGAQHAWLTTTVYVCLCFYGIMVWNTRNGMEHDNIWHNAAILLHSFHTFSILPLRFLTSWYEALISPSDDMFGQPEDILENDMQLQHVRRGLCFSSSGCSTIGIKFLSPLQVLS